MNPRTLSRLSGVAAFTGGASRLAAPLAPRLGERGAQGAYLVIDVFLLLGLVGLYGQYWRALGWAGLAGFCAGLIGACLVRSQAALGSGAYLAGAGLFSIGMAIIGLTFLLNRAPSRLGPALWIASLAIGITGPFWPSGLGLLIAGSLFGLGFMAAGVALIRDQREASPCG